MTSKSPLKPVVVRFNPLTTSYNIVPNRYFYYSVVIYYQSNQYRVFVGKTWSHPYNGNTSVGEIDMEISNILKPYMYESALSIKPEFDEALGEFHPRWNTNQEEITTIDSHNPRNYGFGVMKYWVYLFNSSTNLSGSLSTAVASLEGELTSSWDIDAPAYYHNDDFVMQNLLELEFNRGFISHYPKISTTNFGVFGLVNISDNYLSRYYEDRPRPGGVLQRRCLPIYVGNQVFHMEGEGALIRKVYDAVELRLVMGDGQYATGYLPINVTLYDVLNSLRDVQETPVVFENIVGANASETIQNTFQTGGATAYSPTNTWMGGTAAPHEPARQGYNYSNYVMIMSPDFTWGDDDNPSTGYSVPIGVLDECYSRYYLVWMTRSCVPVCYGFGGNTVFSQDFDNTYMTSKYGNDILKLQTVTNRWELKSGVINKETYSVMEDIYTSPFLLLYDTHKDKCTYVKCMDNSFTRKNSTKEDKQPFYFNVNLQEVHKNELLH